MGRLLTCFIVLLVAVSTAEATIITLGPPNTISTPQGNVDYHCLCFKNPDTRTATDMEVEVIFHPDGSGIFWGNSGPNWASSPISELLDPINDGEDGYGMIRFNADPPYSPGMGPGCCECGYAINFPEGTIFDVRYSYDSEPLLGPAVVFERENCVPPDLPIWHDINPDFPPEGLPPGIIRGPEPSSMALIVCGLLTLLFARSKREC